MTEPRFCDQCGLSLVGLAGPHVVRTCVECGKEVHVAEPGDGGRGIRIREGDRFTVPKGWLTMSLDPSIATGRFFRPGLTWFVSQLVTANLPTDRASLDEWLVKRKEESDQLLESSEKLSHFDLDDERDAEAAVEVIEKDRQSVEWWALLLGASASDVQDRLESGETTEAAVSVARLQAAKFMLLFMRSLEEQLWTGYRHTQLIYDIAAAAARTPADAEAIQALRPLFSSLDEDVLHAWVESGLDIGPRINVTQVHEGLLKALAQFHLELFERRRAEQRFEREQASSVWANRIAGAGVGVTATAAIGGLLHLLGVF